MTFKELIYTVLKDYPEGLTAKEVWQKAVATGLDQQLGTTGKTPHATLSARLGTFSTGSDPFILTVPGSKPIVYKLAAQPTLKANNEQAVPIQSVTEVAVQVLASKTSYHEKDLHPVLAFFAATNQHFKAHTKTINHSTSIKGAKGQNEWLHPDMVGVRYAFQEYSHEVATLIASIDQRMTKLFTFELKRELTTSNLRECYFQAVSNSSWANEGYLVAAEIDPQIEDELRRLNSAFGIGVIKLNLEQPSKSEIRLPARMNSSIDLATINRLVEQNDDFKTFISFVNDDIQVKKVKSQYDKVEKEEILIDRFRQF